MIWYIVNQLLWYILSHGFHISSFDIQAVSFLNNMFNSVIYAVHYREPWLITNNVYYVGAYKCKDNALFKLFCFQNSSLI